MKLKFLDEFLKNAKVTSFMKIRPVVAELLHADRLTDVKLIVAFRSFTCLYDLQNKQRFFLCAALTDRVL